MGFKLSDESNFAIAELHTLSEPSWLTFEPVGLSFEKVIIHRERALSQEVSSSESEDEEDDLPQEEEDPLFLASLHPKDWKEQDHYKVLGLGSLRFDATATQIRNAYRRKVLRHHPDKRRARGESVMDEQNDYFACITKAYGVLGDMVKRRAFDSVDPMFDDDVPDTDDALCKSAFFQTFGPVFERNARFSKSKRVPKLGTDSTSQEVVENFYNFWFSFDSWREFSYKDEEDKERGEDRYERRAIEKQNKVERMARKKQETSRIQNFVEHAYTCDPRIAKFREEEQRRKEEMKRAKQEAAMKRRQEVERVRLEEEEAVRLKKEKEEAEARKKLEAEKRDREAIKKALKKERRTLRSTGQRMNYWSEGDDVARMEKMASLERLAELLSLIELKSLNKDFEEKGADESVFNEAVKELDDRLEEEKRIQNENLFSKKQTEGRGDGKGNWSVEETQLLVRATQLIPQGTNDRWKVVAEFMSQHCPMSKRSPKEILTQMKELQKINAGGVANITREINAREFMEREKKPSRVSVEATGNDISLRYDKVSTTQPPSSVVPVAAVWSAEEQLKLEQALRTYNTKTDDRWDRIQECVDSKTKKECMLRYRELALLVKAKKNVSSRKS